MHRWQLDTLLPARFACPLAWLLRVRRFIPSKSLWCEMILGGVSRLFHSGVGSPLVGAMERPDSLDTTDVDGAQTRPLPVRRTEHPFNTNLDIGGSTPFKYSGGTLHASQRLTDSLNPNYKLPSFETHPLPPMTSQPRDVLWTLPQRKWKPEPRGQKEWSDEEKFGRGYLFRTTVPSRESNRVTDITGPQFRFEESRWRKTDPLTPVYFYDGAAVDTVRTRRPHFGSQFTRTPEENYALRTDDILTEKVFNREYPKALIRTRPSNRIDDIIGAQADTRCPAPKVWKTKDPAACHEKLTNRVMDIEGAVAGTGGQGPPLYRTRKQAAIVANTAPRLTTAPPMRAPAPAPSAAARAADIASVAALP